MAARKVYASSENALADVFSGATLLIGGISQYGIPKTLINALADKDISELVCVFSPCSEFGAFPLTALDPLLKRGQISRLITAFPFYQNTGSLIESQWSSGNLSIEVIPQGLLSEKLRAGGAGLGGVFTPVGMGTSWSNRYETQEIDGRQCLFLEALRGDFALVRAQQSDNLGNLIYKGMERNWGPVMAMAADITIAEVTDIYDAGDLDPELIITPGIFVNRLIQSGQS
tara:strand:- start:4325 stop:5011 length:687 start_codon:yes stop_codon:yes gene_type:complete